MSIFDTAQSFINRGVASVERGGKTVSLKVELADANRQREQAYARLGEQAFTTLGADAGFRAGREDLIADVEACVAKCAEIEGRIAGVEAEGAAARAAANAARTCPNCGTSLAGSYKFCMNCGAAVPEANPAARACAQCGTPADAASTFCMNCGAKLPDAAPAAGPQQAGPTGASTQPQQPAWTSGPAPSYETPTGASAPVPEIKPERVE